MCALNQGLPVSKVNKKIHSNWAQQLKDKYEVHITMITDSKGKTVISSAYLTAFAWSENWEYEHWDTFCPLLLSIHNHYACMPNMTDPR